MDTETGAASTERKLRKAAVATGAVFSVLVPVASAVIAVIAIVKADQATTTAENLTAPLLAPTTPLSERGKTITVATQYTRVTKRADFLYWSSRTPQRFVVPVQNGGGGVALTVGAPVIVEDCAKEPELLPRTVVGFLGTYAVPSGGTDQLAYVHPDPHLLRPGYVTADGRRLWFNFDYRVFRPVADPLKPTLRHAADLLLWYTDGASRQLHPDWVVESRSTPVRRPGAELLKQGVAGRTTRPAIAELMRRTLR